MIIYPLCVAGFGTVCRVGVEHTVWVEGSQLEGRCVAQCQDGENAGRYGSPGQSFSTILEILGGVLKDMHFTQTPEVAGRQECSRPEDMQEGTETGHNSEGDQGWRLQLL